MAFAQKLLTATISLVNGSFAGGGNSLTLSGLRMSAKIRNSGGLSQSFLEELAIYGMSLSEMNQLSQVGADFGKYAKNTIVLMAGEAGGAMTPVFAGDIFDTFIDAQNQPEVCFRVTGRPGNYNAVKPVPPTSVQGTADAATLIGQLAKTMGYGFEGNGVSVKISNPYLHGTGMSQVRQIVEAAGLEWTIDATNTLAIWQPSQGRQGSAPLISPQTGMVSYPCVRQARIFVRSLFNPAVKFGGQIQVQSDITAACGIWQITKLDYNLEKSRSPRAMVHGHPGGALPVADDRGGAMSSPMKTKAAAR